MTFSKPKAREIQKKKKHTKRSARQRTFVAFSGGKETLGVEHERGHEEKPKWSGAAPEQRTCEFSQTFHYLETRHNSLSFKPKKRFPRLIEMSDFFSISSGASLRGELLNGVFEGLCQSSSSPNRVAKGSCASKKKPEQKA
jgi:hypothetical protein